MRGQVSVEFAILFAVVLMFFIMAAAFFPQQLRQRDDPKEVAARTLAELKLQLISASTTTGDYRADIALPATISDDPVHVRIHGWPDNIAYVIRASDGVMIDSVYLPNVSQVIDEPGVDGRAVISRHGGRITVTV